jgi:serine/threonine protein kinase
MVPSRIITYVLLCGYSPFRSEDTKELVRETKEAKFEFHKRYWHSVSEQAKAFISRLLKVNPAARPTAAEALADPWLTTHEANASTDLPGMRENFNPRQRWGSAIAAVRAAGRLNVAGVRRRRSISSMSTADSGGWASDDDDDDGDDGYRGEGARKLESMGHSKNKSLGGGPPGENDNIKVIGPVDGGEEATDTHDVADVRDFAALDSVRRQAEHEHRQEHMRNQPPRTKDDVPEAPSPAHELRREDHPTMPAPLHEHTRTPSPLKETHDKHQAKKQEQLEFLNEPRATDGVATPSGYEHSNSNGDHSSSSRSEPTTLTNEVKPNRDSADGNERVGQGFMPGSFHKTMTEEERHEKDVHAQNQHKQRGWYHLFSKLKLHG